MYIKVLLPGILILFVVLSHEIPAQTHGKIRGIVVDASSGEALIGVNLILEGSSLGAATDIEGRFEIQHIPAGNYTLRASMIGYSRKSISAISVREGQATRLDIDLLPETFEMEEVVVEARLLLDNETGLLKDRQKASSISDAISSEDISRSGAGNAASAMNKVTGASTVDGKYLYIRGLGERYTSTQLNGTELPSADPNRKAVALDMFPSNFLENLVTTKTFTPDKPGDYTGGSVNITTKSFPDRLILSLSTSATWNGQTRGADFLTHADVDTDWMGFDRGSRDIPEALRDPGVKVPDISYAFSNRETAEELDRLSSAFNSTMAPTKSSAPINQNFAISFGNQYSILEQPLGFLASVTHGRKYTNYSDGSIGRYQLTGHVDQVKELTNDYLLTDHRSTDEVFWGGLANVTYKPGEAHEIGLNLIYNRTADNVVRYLSGSFARDLTGNSVYETRSLHYTERKLQTYQLRGKHHLEGLGGTRINWIGSMASNMQDEPDLRYFTNNYTIRDLNGVRDTIYAIRPSIYPIPSRYFRNLIEENRSFALDLEIPIHQWEGLTGKIKVGGSYLNKQRRFRERRFDFGQDKIKYDGNAGAFFEAENVGILESENTNGFYRFGNYVIDATSPSNNYDGAQDIYAAYVMLDVSLMKPLRLIVGVRNEMTQMNVASYDPGLAMGALDNADVLPSFNLLYHLRQDMNVRAAYGKTLARPTFRELAPYASFDFVNDYTFIGNANLQRTLIDNYDLRWEWFMRPGEIAAVSWFVKNFRHPIERVIKNVNGEIQYQNVSEARVHGWELEFRKRLDQISPILDDVFIGANFTYSLSAVNISSDELAVIRAVNPLVDGTRELQGQSPYIANANLGYQNAATGTSVSVYYHVFGERLSAVSLGGTPNVYEQSRGMLDLIASQKLFWNVTMTIAVKNLLDESVKHVHHFKDRDYVSSSYTVGRDFNIGFSYLYE